MKILLPLLALLAVACGRPATSTDVGEGAQQVGDVMASLDESSGSDAGNLAARAAFDQDRLLARLESRYAIPGESWAARIVAPAWAGTCGVTNTFTNCVNRERTRTFAGCTIGAATLSGSVALAWSGTSAANACVLDTDGATVTRSPNFTLTGRRGATLTVSKSGASGQVVTRVSAGNFTFANDGIRRVFTAANGVPLFDLSTRTTSPITVTGASRAGRVVSGGTLRVSNALTGVSCDVAPTAVTWTASCNCAVSGAWNGTCTDGRLFSLVLNGCGTAAYTFGETSGDVQFDRCYAI